MTIFKMKFTHAAKCEAAKRGLSMETLEAYIRAQLVADGFYEGSEEHCSPQDLIFHTIDRNEPKPWIVYGKREDGVLVDSASYEEGPGPIREGPFKGYKLMIPTGDDDDA